MFQLTSEQARVLGSLIEKQMTTPEYYPLTANALTAACNQKNNRDPVMDLDEASVERVVRDLDNIGLAGITRSSGGRAVKYLQHASSALEVDDEQLALIAVLLLRGPQTPGELRTRTDRYVSFEDVASVEQRLTDLITRDVPLVERLDREPGRREHRYRCLLAGGGHDPIPLDQPPAAADSELRGRIEALEERVARLESGLGI